MQTIDSFLLYLQKLKIKLWLEGEQLRWSAPEQVMTVALSEQLKERKGEIVSFLRQAYQAFDKAKEEISPTPHLGPTPLSFAQARLWFLEQLQPGSPIHNIPSAYRVVGELDGQVLGRSFNEILRRHETLRTNFMVVDGEPMQVIAAAFSLELPIIELQGLSEKEQETEIRKLAREEAEKPFNLRQDPLIRVKLLRLGVRDSVVLLTLHHLIADGWSLEILIKELSTLYTAFVRGEPSPLADLPIQYADYALWQRQEQNEVKLDSQLRYWKNKLKGMPPLLQLPTDYPRPKIQGYRGASHSFSLPADLGQKLRQLSDGENVTLFTTLLTAFAILLYRYTGQEDIAIGFPIANRQRPELEPLIGLFVNTLVLRNSLSGRQTVKSLLQQVRETTLEAYDHRDISFEKLVEEMSLGRDLSFSPLFQAKFRLENTSPEQIALDGLQFFPLEQEYRSAKLDLSLDLYNSPTGIVGAFEYSRELFLPETIALMEQHFQVLLESMTQNLESQIWELGLLDKNERQQLLVGWNQTQIPYSEDLCFHQWWEKQVEKTPERVALVFEGRELTYQELNEHSNQLARYLQKLGIRPEKKVAIYLERSLEMIVAFLGVMKAGGAYVPLDPAYPDQRIAFMLKDAQVSLVLTTENLGGRLPVSASQLVSLDGDREKIAAEARENPSSTVTVQNLAYLIYTSGSSGTPKGVLLSHEGLVNLTEDKIRTCDVNADSRVLQFFSFSFDASIPEIIMALGSGARLYLARTETLLPGQPLLNLLREQKITHLTLTPSALASVPREELPHLRLILVGGEAPSSELIASWSSGRRFINAYGPTEVTVNASMVLCGNDHPILPTLEPAANKQFYILDSYLEPVPVGVFGELYVAGVGLARGYHNQSEKTALAFIPNPFGSSSARLYRTGDLACYLPDGRVKLGGRRDKQVKIRGFRVEIGEIETWLNQHPQVHTSVVTVRKQTHLVAYCVPELGETLDSDVLRSYLQEHLPGYMVPSAFLQTERVPLTPNGKVDEQALASAGAIVTGNKEYIAPRTPTETSLARIFAGVLGREDLSIWDDFFELGGHSLLATQLIAQALQEFQVELSVIDLFESPNVAQLAQRIERRQVGGQPPEEREEVEF